jgi:hypothetical protein
MTHFIHLHEEAWHTISYDGKRPPPWERGLEDTWQLDPGDSVVVAAKFTDYTGVFMVHCHMLDHEDHGLMAQFAVVNPKTHKLPKGYYYQPSGGARPAVTPAVRTAAPTSYADELRASPLWATIYGTRSAEGTLSRSTVERLLCT